MALYYFHLTLISRGKGQSIVDVSENRACEKLYSRYNNKIYDYSNNHHIIYKEIFLPANAPQSYNDRSILWNSVEESEKLKNSQLARQIKIALQPEIDLATQLKILRCYIKENFVSRGMVADVTVSRNKEKKLYAYILLTLREIDGGGNWKSKSKIEYVLDAKGQRVKHNGKYKQRKIYLNDWSDRETLILWRKNWADVCNNQFKKMGLKLKLDYRIFEKDVDVECC